MRRKVILQIPGTCGELVQSVYQGMECLVSLPIDCYHYVEAYFSESKVDDDGLIGTKAIVAKQLIGDYLSLEQDLLDHIHFKCYGDLTIGIGMASSTADVYGVMAAVAELVEMPLSAETYGKLCSEVEPTDGVMFPHWTLFDHLNGSVLSDISPVVPLKLVMFFANEQVNTVDFRKNTEFYEKLSSKTGEPIDIILNYKNNKDLKLLGQAMTQSAVENQSILYKCGLNELIHMAESFSALGVVCAHSGSILALLFEKEQFERNIDDQAFKRAIEMWQQNCHYIISRVHSTVPGGYQLVNWEAI